MQLAKCDNAAAAVALTEMHSISGGGERERANAATFLVRRDKRPKL